MDDYLKRANEADGLLQKLVERVTALEKSGGNAGASVPPGHAVFDTSKPGMTPPAQKQIRQKVLALKKVIEEKDDKIAKLEQKVKSMGQENAKLKKQLKSGGGKKGGNGPAVQKLKNLADNADKSVHNMKATIEKLTKWRAEVESLQKERDELKAKVGDASSGRMSSAQIEMFRSALQAMRTEVVAYLKEKGDFEEEVAASSGPTLVQMSMDTIQERKQYFVTTDLAKLKKEWEEAELGPLDDDDFKLYLGREVKSLEIEEDDDTVNVRFDNHDTQWFPVTCLFQKVEGAVAAPSGPVRVRMNMETVRERKYYFVTEDMTELKKHWEEAELGPLDDEDFQLYLGRKVYAIDLEEDDDTMNVRFDNHDTQWFPVCCLFEEQEGAAPVAAAAPAGPNAGKTMMGMDTISERKKYYITEDLAELKAKWEEAELGPLDDEDFELYLGREVYAIDLEEDDDTMNVRFDNHDTQWIPVTALYMAGAPAPKPNGSRKQMTMDTVRERKYYFITKCLQQLKKDWEAAELGPLDDEDFQLYLGRKVYAIDLEEDDDTMNVRFDNHDTQWFPVSCLYEE